MPRYSVVALILALVSCAVLFQNCSAAAPPDISNLTQSSTSTPALPATGTNPNPIPAPVATPFATPIPTPAPVSQTYAWNVGGWSSCNFGLKTRSVTCRNNLGTIVSDAFCAAVAKPAASQACTSYTCTASWTTASEFFPGGFCSYSCVGAATYYAFANDASQCNPSPIGVAGTEMFFLADYSQQIPRPFTQCTITRNFSFDVNGYTGESRCE